MNNGCRFTVLLLSLLVLLQLMIIHYGVALTLVLDVMKKLAKGGMTMVIVTHQMGFARAK